MNRACEEYLEELPLYAEGELEVKRAAAIRSHLFACSSCRDWIRRYDELTREILETELGAEETTEESWSPERNDLAPGRGGRIAGRAFTNRVMTGVRRAEFRSRLARIFRAAAVVLIFLGLAAGGLAWLEGPSLDRSASMELAGLNTAEMGDAEHPGPVVSPAGAGDLAPPRENSAPIIWILDPGREQDPSTGGEREALLYSPEEMEGHSDLEYLTLRALLGLSRSRSRDPRLSNFLMVPEKAGSGRAIPLRPVALPVRVPAREISTHTRVRLESRGRRYRIIWLDGPGLQARPGLGVIRQPSSRGFPFSSLSGLELESAPLIEN